MSKKSQDEGITGLQKFREKLFNGLSKLSDSSTTHTGTELVKEIMRTHITNTDRMNLFITMISDFNLHMKITTKREYIKLFGIAGEIFEESFIPFVPKILHLLVKKVIDPQIHVAVSDALGVLIHHTLKNLDSEEDKHSQLSFIISLLFQQINSNNKIIQIGCAMCLTRAIQNSPLECLSLMIGDITNRLLETLRHSTCKCQTQLLEGLISLILAVEMDFEPHAIKFLTPLLESMSHPDWTTRKMALDVIYTFAAFIPTVLIPYRVDILQVLKHCKIDKLKPVREAALEAITKLNEIQRGGENLKKGENEREESKSISSQGPRLSNPKLSERDKHHIGERRIKRKLGRREKHKDSPKTSIFKGPINTNFFLAAPKKEIEIRTSHQTGWEQKKEEYDEEEHPVSENPVGGPSEYGEQHVTSGMEFTEETKEGQTQESVLIQREESEEESELSHIQPEIRGTGGEVIRGSPQRSTREGQGQRTPEVSTSRISNRPAFDLTNSPVPPQKNLNVNVGGEVRLSQSHSGHKQQRISGDAGGYNNNRSNERYTPLQGSPSETNPATHSRIATSIQGGEDNVARQYSSVPRKSPALRYSGISTPPKANLEINNVNNINNNIQTLTYDLEKSANQQLKMMESMNSFQKYTRTEINLLKERIGYLEGLVDKMTKSEKHSPMQEHSRYEEVMEGKEWPQRGSGGKREDNVWHKALHYLHEGKLNEAYSCILAQNDDPLLIRLMGRTRIILEVLDKPNMEYLLTRILDMISSGDFIDFLLPWMTAWIDRKIPLTINLQSSILDCFGILLQAEDKDKTQLEEVQICEINRIYNLINNNLALIQNEYR